MVNLTCAWCFIANMTILNIEWPDGNSQYYGTVVNTTNLKINGTFPNSRYFSYELYSLDTWEPFWDIHDNEIINDVNPYSNPNIMYNHSIYYDVELDIKDKKENTTNYIILYRIYLGENNTGGVNLPNIYTYSNENNGSWNIIPQCKDENRPTIDIQDTTPQYELYRTNENDNFYPPQNKSNLFINYDARYMIAFYNNSDLSFKGAKITIQLPTYPHTMNNISTKSYQVRYYSVSIVDLSSPRQTSQTIYDVDLSSSSVNNTATIYLFCHNVENISLQLFPPSTNDHNCSSKIQYFGVLYRQLLPFFENEIPNTPNANKNELMKMMGNYYPRIHWV
tara:strand:+ start:136 stop:1143 length:1008 start_codon:yes stop_codon:yes gene_type:complete